MPKQRGGPHGALRERVKANGSSGRKSSNAASAAASDDVMRVGGGRKQSGKRAVADDDDFMYDEIDRYNMSRDASHGQGHSSAASPSSRPSSEDDIDPVLDLNLPPSSDDEADLSHDVEGGWGAFKSAYYSHDAEVEVDDDAAQLEEVEVHRLQLERGQALDEADVAVDDAEGATSTAVTALDLNRDGLELSSLLESMQSSAVQVASLLQLPPPVSTSTALFLQVQVSLLLSYLNCTTLLLLFKSEADLNPAHPLFAAAVSTRTLMEKLEPLAPVMMKRVATQFKSSSGPEPSRLEFKSEEEQFKYSAPKRVFKSMDVKPTRFKSSGVYADLKASIGDEPEEVAEAVQVERQLESEEEAGYSRASGTKQFKYKSVMQGVHVHTLMEDLNPAASIAGKRSRVQVQQEEVDDFISAARHAVDLKKARRAEAAAVQVRPDEDELVDDVRRASRVILANRGLVRYRKASERNPRVANRHKAEKRATAVKGQVVPMRTDAKEREAYAGEATGIRTSVTHSRRIRS